MLTGCTAPMCNGALCIIDLDLTFDALGFPIHLDNFSETVQAPFRAPIVD